METGIINGVADEAECGISAFVAPSLKPINGILKSCPEDFRVREVPLSGTQGSASSQFDQPHEFIRFTLHKRGIDTLEAIDQLATACGIPSRHFGFAGIKDSWAVTTQEVTVPKAVVPESVLISAASELPLLRLSNFRSSDTMLAPGMLNGNRFLLRVQHVSASSRKLRNVMRSLRRRGFVNYVGMQRFGKAGVRSDWLGLSYLHRDYEQCVDLLLHQKDSSLTGHRARRSKSDMMPRWAESYQRTNSAASALRLMPQGGLWAERKLLSSIRRFQENTGRTTQFKSLTLQDGCKSWKDMARQAFLGLPRTIRALYAHAYIDRLWNFAATERVARLGLQGPVDGDIIGDNGREEIVHIHHTHEGGPEKKKRKKTRKMKEDHKMEDNDNTPQYNADKPPTIFDVRMPRPGTGALLPENQIGEFIRSYLSYDDLEPESLCFEGSGAGQSFHLRGVHRPLLARPDRLRWMQEIPAVTEQSGCRSVLVDFGLAPGQYATMAMREIMRKRPPSEGARHIVFDSDIEST